MTLKDRLRRRAKALKRELHVLVLASHDPRVGWLPRALVGVAIAYALSPIDLIPDFIPVLGLLDDLVLVPALLALALRQIPPQLRQELRARADAQIALPRRGARSVAVVVVLLWLALLGAAAWLVYGLAR